MSTLRAMHGTGAGWAVITAVITLGALLARPAMMWVTPGRSVKVTTAALPPA
ncbi:hypothetical protein [Dactylosporangium sp. NPDC051541]|uniref:hypothetical protein n=1 Tax=Dactylosporangium sp. NPDC051541 TaxID=3363977 RepID=UPI0037ACE1E4